MHGVVGKYYSMRDWAFGLTQALLHLPQTLVNIGNPIPNNKLVALMRLNGVSKQLSTSYENLYKSRAGKLIKAGTQVGIGALLGHLLGQTGWFGAETALMYAGLGMGIFSLFDYFSNQILLAAHYHNVRFYNGYTENGNTLVPAGFYTKKQLKRAF